MGKTEKGGFLEAIWNPNLKKYQLSYFREVPPEQKLLLVKIFQNLKNIAPAQIRPGVILETRCINLTR